MNRHDSYTTYKFLKYLKSKLKKKKSTSIMQKRNHKHHPRFEFCHRHHFHSKSQAKIENFLDRFTQNNIKNRLHAKRRRGLSCERDNNTRT